MPAALLRDLYAYNDDANRSVLDVLHAAPIPPDEALRLFSHILNAHAVWLARIAGTEPPYGVWQMHPLARLAPLHVANQEATLPLLTPDRLPDTIDYRTSKGTPYRNTVQEILIHVVNHGTYHRGQVATVLRKSGFEPPVTDYVFFKRTP